jgi:hypothetical protein
MAGNFRPTNGLGNFPYLLQGDIVPNNVSGIWTSLPIPTPDLIKTAGLLYYDLF